MRGARAWQSEGRYTPVGGDRVQGYEPARLPQTPTRNVVGRHHVGALPRAPELLGVVGCRSQPDMCIHAGARLWAASRDHSCTDARRIRDAVRCGSPARSAARAAAAAATQTSLTPVGSAPIFRAPHSSLRSGPAGQGALHLPYTPQRRTRGLRTIPTRWASAIRVTTTRPCLRPRPRSRSWSVARSPCSFPLEWPQRQRFRARSAPQPTHPPPETTPHPTSRGLSTPPTDRCSRCSRPVTTW
jgi:hypothetical protein